MKSILVGLVASLVTCGCSNPAHVPAVLARGAQEDVAVNDKKWDDLTDPAKAAQAKAVLRVKFISSEGGDKYSWDKVEVLHIIKGESSFEFPKEMEVAHYSWEPGIPEGESTIYLEPYSPESKTLWKLLDGTAKHGVSHAH